MDSNTETGPRWSKKELLEAESLTGAQRDVLNAALDNTKKYTLDEAKAAVKAFKGGLF
jgi:hypothetical protein